MNLTKHARAIPDEVLDVLRSANYTTWDYETNRIVLKSQLERKLYQKVSKILENYGGKWHRNAGAHVFQGDYLNLLRDAVDAGKFVDEKKAYQFYATPLELARQMVVVANIRNGDRVLEPSAGEGAIALAAFEADAVVDCVEVHEVRAKKLRDEGFRTVCCDFLDLEPEEEPVYDAVVMNPPFANLADIDHVLHAYRFLKPLGRLVAVMSPAYTFHSTIKAAAFREFVNHPSHHGLKFTSETHLSAGTFKESGTDVRSMLVVLQKESQ